MPLMITCAEGGSARPVIVCDHCGREIAEARDGSYRWKIPPDAGGPPKLVYFTHKGCCRAFEKDHPEPPWGVADLDGLPALLAETLGGGPPEAAAKAWLLSPVG
jgi:hypothetical protein